MHLHSTEQEKATQRSNLNASKLASVKNTKDTRVSCSHAQCLLARFSEIQALDLLATDPPSMQTVELLSQLRHLRRLQIEVRILDGEVCGTEGAEMLSRVAKLTGLTHLHLHKADVSSLSEQTIFPKHHTLAYAVTKDAPEASSPVQASVYHQE